MALYRELGVQGVLEGDAFRTMVAAIWRKQHLSIFKLAAESRALYGRFFRFPNDRDGFRKYMALKFQIMIKLVEIQNERHERSQQNPTQEQSPEEDAQIDAPIFVDDQSLLVFGIESLKKVMKIQLGSEFEEEWKKLQADPSCGDPRIMLAMQGELITPECLIAELEMNDRLDDAIDRSYNRLKKFQADRNKPSASSSMSPLLQHRKLHRKR
jgi:hypothetical protein